MYTVNNVSIGIVLPDEVNGHFFNCQVFDRVRKEIKRHLSFQVILFSNGSPIIEMD